MAGEPVRVMQWEGEWFGRLWTAIDVITVIVLLAMHGLAHLAPFHFSWSAFWTAMAIFYVTGFGVTVSYHRNLAHRSFKLPKWIEYSLAYCAVLSLQGSPIDWVSTHRTHHRFADTSSDPHTPPLKGFWYSHVGWIIAYHSRFATDEPKLLKNVEDLKKQWYYRFLHYTYHFHAVSIGVVLYAAGGLPFLVWGLDGSYPPRNVFDKFDLPYLGKQVWDTYDSLKNNWFFGVLALGEGWHNNHHAFEYSARQGLEWWQINVAWYFIRFLEAIGLATDVNKLPSESQMKQKTLCNKLKRNGNINFSSEQYCAVAY